jgi:site-specific DNA-adenine methylase
MTLKPFFHYFGAKYRIGALYPEPRHPTIVEPFAGSATYSLRYPDRSIHLYDLDPTICELWEYLIRATDAEIMRLPVRWRVGENIPIRLGRLGLPPECATLLGFICQAGKVPASRVTLFSKWTKEYRYRIASQLQYIRHWRVYNETYENAARHGSATYFIDPPYCVEGKGYRYGSGRIRYAELARWAKTRKGQVIVCESANAQWLPFRYLTTIQRANANATDGGLWFREGIWTND